MNKQEFSGYDGILSIGEKTIAFGNFKIKSLSTSLTNVISRRSQTM